MKKNNLKGLIIAIFIILLWGVSLILLLKSDITISQPVLIVPGILWQTFLYTGSFITAHDAMHGTVLFGNRRINMWVGTIAVWLYALFSYKKLRQKHFMHHRSPASVDDPDYHDGHHKGFFFWYIHFMKNYITIWQLVGMAIIFNVLKYALDITTLNLILFWVTPAILSTLQLFYFGTYLPHQEPETGYDNHHRARSNDYKVLWSFVTCYHFGFHWEHHEFPNTPWWRLPARRKKAN